MVDLVIRVAPPLPAEDHYVFQTELVVALRQDVGGPVDLKTRSSTATVRVRLDDTVEQAAVLSVLNEVVNDILLLHDTKFTVQLGDHFDTIRVEATPEYRPSGAPTIPPTCFGLPSTPAGSEEAVGAARERMRRYWQNVRERRARAEDGADDE